MSASSMKQIKNRIKSIKGTMQITKAMQLVAASKMRKMSERIEKAKPYFNTLTETVNDIARDNKDFSSVFTRERDGKRCHIVIAGDRGLAGGYNYNLFKSIAVPKNDIIFPIGRKAADHFKDFDIFTMDYDRADSIKFADCEDIGNMLAKEYEKGKFTSLTLSYTSFVNMLVQNAQTKNLLPIKAQKKSDSRSLTIYEPDAETVFAKIVPYYLAGMIYGAVTESVTSETAARRNAMESATDNASEMIDRLSLEYNRARQASITRELTEITAGWENM